MMKFPRVKIWKAVSKEKLTGNPMRNAICHIKYDAEDNVLIAIDGFIMAVAEVEGDVPKQSVLITRRAIKAAYRQKRSLFLGDDYVETLDGATYPMADGVDDYPDRQNITKLLPGDEDCYEVLLDVDLLARLVTAISETNSGLDSGRGRYVTLVVNKNDVTAPIKVVPHCFGDQSPTWGVIMPCAPPIKKRR